MKGAMIKMLINDFVSSSSSIIFEHEIKIDVNDKNLFKQLTDHNVVGAFNLVIDKYYDFNSNELLVSDEVLRIRQINDTYFLAYKGKRSITENIIEREEYEVSVNNESIYTIVQRFFSLRDVVEKKRAIILDEKFPNLTIYCDVYPFIGCYIEVEGNQELIRQYVNHHNIPHLSLEKRNCTEIFIDYCEKKSINFDNVRCAFKFSNE